MSARPNWRWLTHEGRAEPASGDAPEQPNAHERATVSIEIPPRQVLRAVLITVAVVLVLLFVWQVQEVLALLLIALLLATALEPLVKALSRGPFSRGSGVLVIYTALVLAIGIPTYLALPGLVQQTNQLLEDLPGKLESLRTAAQSAPPPIQQAAQAAATDGTTSASPPTLPTRDQLLEAGVAAAHLLFDLLMVFVLAFYWIIERQAIKRVTLRAVPQHKARDANLIWTEVEDKLGGWVRGEIVLMIAVGVMSGVGYWLLGLPNALALAVLAGLLEIVPVIGPILSSAPAVLFALASDPLKALAVAGYALVVQQVENNVLVPRVIGRTIGISPMAVLVGILVGAALYGIPGAFLAAPVAGALQVVLAHFLRTEDPPQAEVHAVR